VLCLAFPRRSIRIVRKLSHAGLIALALPGGAGAEGLFDSIFNQRPPPTSLPAQTNAYADPFANPQAGPRSSGGAGRISYCVRLCDGRFFPMQRHAGATPVQLCNAFCPASPTQVFIGGSIDHASGPRGARYSDLENAYLYREKVVPDCTCNGKDAFGLAPIDVANDPTLRAGDMVVTARGHKTVAVPRAKHREPTPSAGSLGLRTMPAGAE
jgi:Protein of unknown function (DUF2865)